MNSIAAVREWLQSRPGKVRIVGSGSRQPTRAAPAGTHTLDLSRCREIVRLDPGDQTCTVECGVRREELDAALAEHDLELPCLSDNEQGTIGGLFASDPLGPAAAGSPGPRNLLLGMDALLADGTQFRSGAPVVKSVAGFDVHKLLVGSHGHLYVAARLHLRLKPRPRHEQWFANDDLDRERALALLRALRSERLPPTALQLRRARGGSFTVLGKATGRAVHVNGLLHRHELNVCDRRTQFHVEADETGGETVITGQALPSALPTVLAALPDSAPFAWLGGGRFEAALPAGTDNPLHRPVDPGEQRLADGLKRALDPDGILV